MKIAYLLGEFPSLSETFIAREIEALRRRDFEIEIWALRPGKGVRAIPELTTAQCLVKPFKRFSSVASEKYFVHLGSHWAKVHRDELRSVDHIHAGWASHLAWIAFGAAQKLKIPFSFSGHARDLWVNGQGFSLKLRAAKFASACTRAGIDFLQSFEGDNTSISLETTPGSKVLYAPHGIELSRYGFLTNRKLHTPIRLLAVGRLVEKKGFPVLLNAIANLLQQNYTIELNIIGEGSQHAELEKQIVQQKISNVTLVGARSQTEVLEAMSEADLFVMPSIQALDGDRDGLPNVLLEAAACGLPIVSTRAGSIEDFLNDERAWLCNSENAASLVDAVKNAIENYDESLRRARNARAVVETDFDIDKNIDVLARAFLDSPTS